MSILRTTKLACLNKDAPNLAILMYFSTDFQFLEFLTKT